MLLLEDTDESFFVFLFLLLCRFQTCTISRATKATTTRLPEIVATGTTHPTLPSRNGNKCTHFYQVA